MNECPSNGTAANANHCWHDSGVILTSYPAQRQEVCCYCGQTRNIRQSYHFDQSTHGPYLPSFGTSPGGVGGGNIGTGGCGGNCLNT